MIKIICGVYGFNDGGSIVPKTKKDGPFSLDKKEEARLVKLGVAEYVGKAPAEKQEEKKPTVDRQALIKEFKELKLQGNPAQKSNDALIEAIKEAKENAAGKSDETDADKDGEGKDGEGKDDESGKDENDESGNGNEGDGENEGDDAPDLSGEDGVA